MVFSTTTAASGNMDLSFFGNIGVAGWTPIAGRGYVRGTVTGVRTTNKVVSWLVILMLFDTFILPYHVYVY